MEELIKHYVDLLIIQYRTKMKAMATIESFVKVVFADDSNEILLNKIQNAYDLDTASLAQLNVLAKYIGYDDSLNLINNNYFRLSDTEGADVTPGLSDTEGQYIGYPLLNYSGYTYTKASLSGLTNVDFFRKVLKFLAEMKNEILSVGNIDRILYKHFGEDISVKEGSKSIEYSYSQEITDLFNGNELVIETFFKKYFPKPMGCSMNIVKMPLYLNLIPYGGAESGLDSDFIYTGTEDDVSKYFEMPYDIDITINDTFEIGVRVKINGDYTLSGFFQLKDSPQLSALKRRIDGTITATGYGYTFPLCNYADIINEWLDITIRKDDSVYYGGFLGTVKAGDQVVADNVPIAVRNDFSGRFQFAIANIGQISYYGFIGQYDFKKCYIKKNGEYIWKGYTNKRIQGV